VFQKIYKEYMFINSVNINMLKKSFFLERPCHFIDQISVKINNLSSVLCAGYMKPNLVKSEKATPPRKKKKKNIASHHDTSSLT